MRCHKEKLEALRMLIWKWMLPDRLASSYSAIFDSRKHVQRICRTFRMLPQISICAACRQQLHRISAYVHNITEHTLKGRKQISRIVSFRSNAADRAIERTRVAFALLLLLFRFGLRHGGRNRDL